MSPTTRSCSRRRPGGRRWIGGRVVGAARLAVLAVLAGSTLGGGLVAQEAKPAEIVDGWIARQRDVHTWSAAVTQTRNLRSLARPLVSEGEVLFAQPNRFRWQLGSPPRTIAVRSQKELLVAYPKLQQVEKYPMDGELDPSWRQVLALLEVGFPRDADAFYASYEVLAVTPGEGLWRIEMQPAARQARDLIGRIRVELSRADFSLLSTELDFPDGSSMRNQFSHQQVNPALDDARFEIEIGDDWEVVNAR